MRTAVLPLICLAGCLLSSGAAGQTSDIPARLSLADAIRLSIERNPTLDAARHQVTVAQADVAAARRWTNPVATVLSEGYNGQPRDAGFFNRQELSLQVEQEFEMAGRRRFRSEIAGASAGVAQFALDDQARQLRLEVQRAYFQLVLARLDADLARASLVEIDKVIAINRSRYQQGEVSGGELRRLEVERLTFSDDALLAELAIRNSRGMLLALLGAPRLDLPLDPIDTLDAPLASVVGLPGPVTRGPEGLTDALSMTGQALAARPDVAGARQEQARAQADVGLQRAFRTPNLSVAAGIKRDFGTNGLVWGVSVPLPLFDRNAAGMARADAERRLAESRVRARALAVSLEVQQAVNLVDISRARVGAIERDYLQKAREARDAVLAAYRAGEGELLNFLDAQRIYRDVQRAYNRARFDHRLSLFQLDAAVGAGPGGLLP